MFINTIAVGPLLLVLSWVTGGTIVAMPLVCRHEDTLLSLTRREGVAEHVARRDRLVIGVRIFISVITRGGLV